MGRFKMWLCVGIFLSSLLVIYNSGMCVDQVECYLAKAWFCIALMPRIYKTKPVSVPWITLVRIWDTYTAFKVEFMVIIHKEISILLSCGLPWLIEECQILCRVPYLKLSHRLIVSTLRYSICVALHMNVAKWCFGYPYHNLPLCFFGENFDSDNGGGIDSQTF